jgi:hypothetical protein
VAIDICPHMWPPEEIPDNLVLQVDNVNERWAQAEKEVQNGEDADQNAVLLGHGTSSIWCTAR